MLRIETHPDNPPRGLLTATVREDLGLSSQFDRRIERTVEDATAAGEVVSSGFWVYREFFERIILERSSRRLYLQARPVQSVTSVFLDGQEFIETEGDFEVFPGFLFREDGWHANAHKSHGHSHSGGIHFHTGRAGWEVRYFGGYWLPASMGPARSSFAGTLESPGTPLVDGAVAEGATTMGIKGGVGMETIEPPDVFTVEGISGSFRFLQPAVATVGVIPAPPDGFFEPAAPAGGFPDGAALNITHGSLEIDQQGIHLRRALQEVVRNSWFQGSRNSGNCDTKVPPRADGPVGIIVHPTALAVFRQEGSLSI